jgi:hypothetical protein
MHFTGICMGIAQVFSFHVLRQQMAPVAGGVNQHIGRGRCHRSVQNRLERLVPWFTFIKTQVVTENDKLFGSTRRPINNVWQIYQSALSTSIRRKTHASKFVQQARISDDFPVPRAPSQQHVVGRCLQTARVPSDFFLLGVDFLQIVQTHDAPM